jgi:hypothetical protein
MCFSRSTFSAFLCNIYIVVILNNYSILNQFFALWSYEVVVALKGFTHHLFLSILILIVWVVYKHPRRTRCCIEEWVHHLIIAKNLVVHMYVLIITVLMQLTCRLEGALCNLWDTFLTIIFISDMLIYSPMMKKHLSIIALSLPSALMRYSCSGSLFIVFYSYYFSLVEK